MTTGALTPQRLATALLAAPSADSSTICARRTKECGRLRERKIEPSCDRSDGLLVNAIFGLPIPSSSAGTDGLDYVKLFMGHNTRRLGIAPEEGEWAGGRGGAIRASRSRAENDPSYF